MGHRERAEAVYIMELMEILRSADEMRPFLEEALMDPGLPTEIYKAISDFIAALDKTK